jgi:putative oxidoreductase
VLSVGAELVGGLMLAFGLVTPLAAAILVGQSVVIIAKAHAPRGFWNTAGGFEYPLALGTSAFVVGLIGPGSFSLDGADGFAITAASRLGLLALGLAGGLVALALPGTRWAPGRAGGDRRTASQH